MTAPPPALPPISWTEVRRDKEQIELKGSFPSSFPTDVVENQTVPIFLFLPAASQFRAPFPVVLTLHYLGANNLNEERALARRLNRLGIASAAIELPFHMSRAPAGTRSGELAIPADPLDLANLMEQSLLDVRRAIDQLTLRSDVDATRVGVSGISLGSLVAELAFGIDHRIRDAAFVLGGVDLAHILWHSSLSIGNRINQKREGMTEAKLRSLVEPVEPSDYLATRTSPGRTFVIGAEFDTIVPVVDTRHLVAALPDPKVLWVDTGHYGGIFVQHRLLVEVADFFGSVDFDKPYTPPRSIHAPTLRLLGQIGSPTGFDIAVGLDLFRTRELDPLYANIALTARGPELFLAKTIGKGFAIGGGVGLRGPIAGVFWSTIL